MRRKSGFTIIELLIVITVISILAAIGIPVMMQVYRKMDITKCANHMRSMGQILVGNSVQYGYPTGDPTHPELEGPANWGTASRGLFSGVLYQLHDELRVTACPASKSGSPTDPRCFSTCSYGYMGSLSPTYPCQCSYCKDDSRPIWRLFWSGVNYGGVGSHLTVTGQALAFSTFKNLPLADNLRFVPNEKNADGTDSEGESRTATIPDHQDITEMHNGDKKKWYEKAALRELPLNAGDNKGSLPLLMDIVAYRGTNRPAAAATSWKASDLPISTVTDRDTFLFANHCNTSPKTKADWGANIFYATGEVKWKRWDELRFQVMQKGVNIGGGVTKDLCYFF